MKNKSPFQEHCQKGTTVPAGLPLFLIGGIFMKMVENLGMLSPTVKSKRKNRFAIYECPICRRHFKTQIALIKSGNTKSCGCTRKIKLSALSLKHGCSQTAIYKIWRSIKQRCGNTNDKGYKNYGGRGICICQEWDNDFVKFKDWAFLNGYCAKVEIDRINNDGNYTPENCRFVSHSVNNQNKRILTSRNKSGYRGVSFDNRRKKWVSQIAINKKTHYLGGFNSKELAAVTYNNYVMENKTFHPLNIIP
jgi:hypothetical protein